MSKQKLKAGSMQFRGLSRDNFEASGLVEYDKYGFKAYVLLSIFQDFKRDEEHTIHMQLDTYTLRQLIEGLRSAKVEEEGFKTNTGGSSATKTLFIKLTSKGDTFINMIQGEKKLAVSFNRYQCKAMSNALEVFCDQLDRIVIEREIEKCMKAVRLPIERKKDAEHSEKDESRFKAILKALNALDLK